MGPLRLDVGPKGGQGRVCDVLVDRAGEDGLKRVGPVLALEGEFVPRQGMYIRRSKVGEELWGRLTLAASGKL